MSANATLAQIRHRLKQLPWVGQALSQAYRRFIRPPKFAGSANYWEQHYAKGGNSGAGSYGQLAEYKASVLNEFVEQRGIQSVVEFGCGDGNQLSLAQYPRYTGYDVSQTAVERCRSRFADDTTKSFDVVPNYAGQRFDLALSLDVVFHLVEDSIFEQYMQRLFSAAERFVIVYSSNQEHSREHTPLQIKHRKFTRWVEEHAPDWQLLEERENPFRFKGDSLSESFAHFFMFGKKASA